MQFCSIVAKNFIPHARVLAESLAEHHREAVLEVLVVDTVADGPIEAPAAREPFRRIGLGELGLPLEELNRRSTMYTVAELVSSLRGHLLTSRLAASGGPVLYLDADMLVLAPLTDIATLAARYGIVLTPHATVPLHFKPGGFGPEQTFLRGGVFNGGFLAVSPAATDFLAWRNERTARDCVVAPDREIVLGQKWLALVPALFDHVVLRDRGVNLTGHGMGQDDLDWRGEQPWIGDTPVRLFHFAGGFEPRAGEAGGFRTAPPWWPRAAERPGFARLCERYGQRLLRAGFSARPAEAPGRLDRMMRNAYIHGLIEAEESRAAEPPNPFSHGDAAFSSWLMSAAWPGTIVSRYIAALYAARRDLRAAFPRVPGDDEAALMTWVADKYGGELPVGLPTFAATQ